MALFCPYTNKSLSGQTWIIVIVYNVYFMQKMGLTG